MATAGLKPLSKAKRLQRAPLMQPDKNELGDKRLDPKESVAAQREDLLSLRHKKHAFPGQHEGLADADRSTGARLYFTEIIARLQKIKPVFLVKDGIPGNVALYVRKTAGEMAASGYDLTRPQWHNEHKYITGFPKDWLPEWGHLTTDTDGIADKELRGWRSVLMAIIKSEAIGYAEAVAEFGDPADDQRSRFWFEQLATYKK